MLKEDSGQVIDTIDLAGMTTGQIHEFLQEKGFERMLADAKQAVGLEQFQQYSLIFQDSDVVVTYTRLFNGNDGVVYFEDRT